MKVIIKLSDDEELISACCLRDEIKRMLEETDIVKVVDQKNHEIKD